MVELDDPEVTVSAEVGWPSGEGVIELNDPEVIDPEVVVVGVAVVVVVVVVGTLKSAGTSDNSSSAGGGRTGSGGAALCLGGIGKIRISLPRWS